MPVAAHLCAGMHSHNYRGQRLTLSFSIALYLMYRGRVSHLNPELTDFASLASLCEDALCHMLHD